MHMSVTTVTWLRLVLLLWRLLLRRHHSGFTL